MRNVEKRENRRNVCNLAGIYLCSLEMLVGSSLFDKLSGDVQNKNRLNII